MELLRYKIKTVRRMIKIVTLILGIGLFSACGTDPAQKEVPAATQKILTEAQALLQQTFIAHGGERYDQANYQFVFRKKAFTFKHSPDGYTYTSRGEKDGKMIFDNLENGTLTRTIDGVNQDLTDKQKGSYSESLNSVIYFATLPHKLLDPAVNLEIVGETIIKEKSYDILEVTFDQEGGGEDFDDQFHYWINKGDHTIDYLAYNYKTNEGGVRFRSAYNRRVVDGIIFQDYVNYKAEIGTPLIDLSGLYEQGELKELSKIETEVVNSLK